METPMSKEVFWLVLNIILTGGMVAPYAIYRVKKLGGLWQVFLTPLPGDNPFDEAWAHRAYRAHMNAFEALALFAPLALAVHVTGTSNAVTEISCAVYFWARLIYAPLYYFEVPVLKTGSWFVGLIATFVLAYQLLV